MESMPLLDPTFSRTSGQSTDPQMEEYISRNQAAQSPNACSADTSHVIPRREHSARGGLRRSPKSLALTKLTEEENAQFCNGVNN